MAFPTQIQIGTRKAFENDYSYSYTKMYIGGQWVYVCERGSDRSRDNEHLMLRYEEKTDGSTIWTAYDTYLDGSSNKVEARQAVFRCLNENILDPGWHTWEINYRANENSFDGHINWQGKLVCETKVPTEIAEQAREKHMQ